MTADTQRSCWLLFLVVQVSVWVSVADCGCGLRAATIFAVGRPPLPPGSSGGGARAPAPPAMLAALVNPGPTGILPKRRYLGVASARFLQRHSDTSHRLPHPLPCCLLLHIRRCRLFQANTTPRHQQQHHNAGTKLARSHLTESKQCSPSRNETHSYRGGRRNWNNSKDTTQEGCSPTIGSRDAVPQQPRDRPEYVSTCYVRSRCRAESEV